MSTEKISYGTYAALAVTALQSLANATSDPYGGWQSTAVDNRTTLAPDYEAYVYLPTANTAPANDKSVYVYPVPWIDTGSGLVVAGDFGTTTAPSGADATCSISVPNNMGVPKVIPYKTQQMILHAHFFIAARMGGVPDGFSFAIRNSCGAAFSTGCVVGVRPIFYTNA